MRDIRNLLNDRIVSITSDAHRTSFHSIKDKFNEMKKQNRKKNAVQKQMFIRFQHKGREVVARIDKMPISIIHATEFRDGVETRTTWSIRSVIKDYWIADC